MKINVNELSKQAITSTTISRKMRLSENASSMVFQLFTKNVYSNPIGTVVREITSNCFDSHVEANVVAPVIIRKHIDNQTGTHNISFIDFGVGMSPERIFDIYGVYFESSKRADDTQIGGFGIGGKTPLAYKRSTGEGEAEYDNSFYVITVFNNIKYWYCIAEGDDSPVIIDLHSEPTTEGNGTEIRIPVLEKDISTFQYEMLRQLYYFENIIFEGFEVKDRTNDEMISAIPNDYQIIVGKSFLFRGEEYDNTMHVCLGRVAYPINYSTLGLNSNDYRLPIALKLEVGDVNVTVSREQLDYSEKTIKLLKKKLEEAKAEILVLINNQYKGIKTLEQYFNVKNDFGKLIFPNNMSLNVGDLIKQKDVDFSDFKYSFMNMPNDKQLFKLFFGLKAFGKKPSYSKWNTNEFHGSYDSLKQKSNILHIDDEWNRKILKQAWLKHEYETYYIVEKRNLADRWIGNKINELFNTAITEVVDVNGKATDFMQSLYDMQDEYMEIVRANTTNYDDLVVPEYFVINRKGGSDISPEMRKQTIPVKFVNGYSKNRVKLSSILDYKMPIFYGTTDDEYVLKDAVAMYTTLFGYGNVVRHSDYNGVLETQNSTRSTKSKNSIMFIQIATNNVKYMKYCKNANHISTFATKMLYRKEEMVLKYFQTHSIVEKFGDISSFYRRGYIGKVSDVWGKKVEAIREFIDGLPETRDISNHQRELSKLFNLEDVKQTKEQEKITEYVEELMILQQKNYKIMNFFNMPYTLDDLTDEMIAILGLSLDLK